LSKLHYYIYVSHAEKNIHKNINYYIKYFKTQYCCKIYVIILHYNLYFKISMVHSAVWTCCMHPLYARSLMGSEGQSTFYQLHLLLLIIFCCKPNIICQDYCIPVYSNLERKIWSLQIIKHIGWWMSTIKFQISNGFCNGWPCVYPFSKNLYLFPRQT